LKEAARPEVDSARYATVRAKRRDSTKLSMLSEKTEFVHVDGHPFLWLLQKILAKCKNLKVLEVTPRQYRHLYPKSHLRILAERSVEVRQGYHLPETGWPEGRPAPRNRHYEEQRKVLLNLTPEQHQLFDELLRFGFESAVLTARYFCLNGEEYMPYQDLGAQFGFSARNDSLASAHVLAVLHYLDPNRPASLASKRHAATLRQRAANLRECFAENEWKSKILAQLGIDKLPDDLPMSKMAVFGRVLHAVRDKSLDVLDDRARTILLMRFGLEDWPSVGAYQVLDTIGERFGVSRERIRQIEEDALKHIGIDEATAELPAAKK